jgi:hypothetical protein
MERSPHTAVGYDNCSVVFEPLGIRLFVYEANLFALRKPEAIEFARRLLAHYDAEAKEGG